MVKRKIVIRQSAAISIAQIAWFIESKGLIATAEKFSDSIYDFAEKLSDVKKRHRVCRDDPERASLGLKCISFRKKYIIVFHETEDTLIVTEFLHSKSVWW